MHVNMYSASAVLLSNSRNFAISKEYCIFSHFVVSN